MWVIFFGFQRGKFQLKQTFVFNWGYSGTHYCSARFTLGMGQLMHEGDIENCFVNCYFQS